MIRVCLIDDDFEVTAILKEELELLSDQVRVTRVAHNVAEAKTVIDNYLPLIDCFILDICMPVDSQNPELRRDAGFAVLRYLRQVKKFAGCVIILTGSSEYQDGKIAFGTGCDVYLCKSRELVDLIDAIHFCLQRSLASPELQHMFLPEEITAREARLMEMLHAGAEWPEIARSLHYGNPGAARIAAEEAFNKVLAWHSVTPPMQKKRDVAMQLWKWRHITHASSFNDEIEHPRRNSLSSESYS